MLLLALVVLVVLALLLALLLLLTAGQVSAGSMSSMGDIDARAYKDPCCEFVK